MSCLKVLFAYIISPILTLTLTREKTPLISFFTLDMHYTRAHAANYYRSRAELAKAEAFCALLVDFVGPEGDEARAIVRDIRSIAITRYQQRSGGGSGSGDASNVNANINANVNVSSSSLGIQRQQQQQHAHGQNLGSFTRTRTPEHRVYNHSTPGTALSGFSGIGSTDSAGAGIYHDTSARPGVAGSPSSEYDPDEIAGHLSMSSDGGN